MTENNHAQPLVNDEWDILDITSISGSETALQGETVSYTASYEHKDPRGKGGENFIEWQVIAGGERISLGKRGNPLDLKMEQKWDGVEIFVVPKSYFGGRYSDSVGQVTEVGEVKKKQITSLSWVNKNMETVNKAKYGKETFLRINTENCFSKDYFTLKYFAFVVVHCDDWKQDYVDSVDIARPMLRGPVQPIENDPEEKIFSFTPKVEWLKDPNVNSSEMVATVYIVCNQYSSGAPDQKKSQEIAETIKENAKNKNNKHYNPYSRYAVKAEEETEKISVSKIAPWMSKAFEEMQLGVKEGMPKESEQSPVKYLNYEGVPAGMRSEKETDAWCGAFVNYVLEESGYIGESENPLAVANWNGKWRRWGEGKQIEKPSYGAIVTFVNSRGGDHMGFVVGISEDNKNLFVLGGNQNDEVNVSKYLITNNFKYFLPKNYEVCDFENNTVYLQQSFNGTIKNGGSTR